MMRYGRTLFSNRKSTCVLIASCILATGVFTGCPLVGPSRQLQDGTRLIAKLKIDGEEIFNRNSIVHNLTPEKGSDGLFVILKEEEEEPLQGLTPPSGYITKEELLAFIESTWHDGSVETFHEALVELECGPEDLIHLIEASGLTPAETIALLEVIDEAYPESSAGSEVVGIHEFLKDADKTLAEFQAAILNEGVDVQTFMAHLSNLGIDTYHLRDMYEAYHDATPHADDDELFQSFIGHLWFAKDAAGIIVEVGKFAYDVLKNSHSVTTADDVTELVHATDPYWANYTKGTLVQSTARWQVYEWNPFGADWLVVDVTFKVIVYYDKTHTTLPGQYLSSAVIADRVWVGQVSSVDASAALTKPQQIGTPENPIPQAFGKIKMASKYLAIPEASDAFSFTVYGDAPFAWGNVPR